MKKRNGNGTVLQSADSAGLQQNRSVAGTIAGMLCRLAVAFCGTLGVCLMMQNAFSFLPENSFGTIALMCAVLCACAFVIYLSAHVHRAFFIVTLTLAAAFLVYYALKTDPDPLEMFIGAPVSLWNAMVGKLASIGYSSLSIFMIKPGPIYVGESLVPLGYEMFCLAVSFVFTGCLFRRPVVLPVIMIAGTVMTITFTYNILTDSVGFLLTVACGFGLLVLKYQVSFAGKSTEPEEKGKVYARRRSSLASSARAGVAAFTAAAIIVAAGIYPALKIRQPAPELKIFTGVMDWARDAFMTLTSGPSGSNEINSDADIKNIQPTERRSTGKVMLTVTAQSREPVYLRSWVGSDFNGESWAATVDHAGYYGFMPEDVTELFYTIVDSYANSVNSYKEADDSSFNRGFVKEAVTVKSNSVRGSTGFLASRFSHKYGITEPGTMYKEYAKEFSYVYGVGTVKLKMKDAEYSTVGYVQNYKGISLSKFNDDMTVYETVYPYVKAYAAAAIGATNSSAEAKIAAETGLEAYLENAREQIREKLSGEGIKIPSGCIISRIDMMSTEDLEELYNKLIVAENYEDEVYATSLSMPWYDSAAVSDHAIRAIASLEGFNGTFYSTEKPSNVYQAADSIARYLARECRYTLKPEGYKQNVNTVSQFLDSAKNGYCVQFATAGALMLRSLGVPTRYVEGYLAADFRASDKEFTCAVTDTYGHAWIEAYVRHYGWMTFEMTAPMLSGMYSSEMPEVVPETEPPETTPPDDETTSPETLPGETTAPETLPGETTAPETDPPDPGPAPGRGALIALICVLVFFALCTAIEIYLKFASKRREKRIAILQRAAEGRSPSPEKDTKRITEFIKFLLGLIDLKRGDTELMSEYAARLNRETGGDADFTAAADAMQKYAFGHEADAQSCAALGEYALFLRDFAAHRLSGAKKFFYVKLGKLI